MPATLRRGRFWTLQLLLLLVWIAMWAAARLLEYVPHASLWFPPAALTWAIFRVFGIRGIVPVFLGAMTATLLADDLYQSQLHWGQLLGTGVLFALAHCTPYYLGARVTRYLAPPGPTRTVARTVTVFLLVALFSTFLAATGGALSLTLLGMIPFDQAVSIIWSWWIGDLVGLITLGAFLIIALERLMQTLKLPRSQIFRDLRGDDHDPRSQNRFATKVLICMGVLGLTLTSTWLFDDMQAVSLAVYFVIFPQMWIAHSENAYRSMASLALISTSIAVATWGFDLGEHALLYQFALVMVATSTYFGMAVPALSADNEALRQLLNFDSLTGATTRHHFLDRANQQLTHAKRYQEPVSLIVIDVDHFKQINDQGGHMLGDRVLTSIAATCLGQLRNSDILGRLGGDEFCVLLPVATLDTALETAQRLRSQIEILKFEGLPEDLPLTASIGVTEIDPARDSFNQAFERADRALYKAKHTGRNRVESA